jgi:DNA-binding LacI/PurR family transcriptional regulator
MVTLNDVAAAAGVSRATASRALTGSGPVAPGVQARIRHLAEQLGFMPNQAARALASRKTYAVALVIPEPNTLVLGDPFLTGMISGVSEAFDSGAYQLLLVIVRPDDAPGKVRRLLTPSQVDGAIIVSHHRGGPLAQLSDFAVPTVFVGRPWDAGAMYVDVDNQAGARTAGARLVQRGAARIGCLAGPADMTVVQDRLAGWRQALQEADQDPGPVAFAPFTALGGRQAMRQLADQGCDALFVQSDLMALGAMQVLAESGVRVGSEVLVIGVDDSEFARTATPSLTSVTNPAAELSRRAAHMLLRVVDDGVEPAAVTPEIIQPRLVLRESA